MDLVWVWSRCEVKGKGRKGVRTKRVEEITIEVQMTLLLKQLILDLH